MRKEKGKERKGRRKRGGEGGMGKLAAMAQGVIDVVICCRMQTYNVAAAECFPCPADPSQLVVAL